MKGLTKRLHKMCLGVVAIPIALIALLVGVICMIIVIPIIFCLPIIGFLFPDSINTKDGNWQILNFNKDKS